jgi:hypothetical protein
MKLTSIALALGLLSSSQAIGQTASEADRATAALAANWRAIALGEMGSPTAISAACEGAIDEIAELDARLPETLTPLALAQVHPPRGLIFVRAATPDGVFAFVPANIHNFTSGLAQVTASNQVDGRIVLRDAAGAAVALQIGRVASRPVLRMPQPQGEELTLVGCAPTPSR